jgi:hypothetical protein
MNLESFYPVTQELYRLVPTTIHEMAQAADRTGAQLALEE